MFTSDEHCEHFFPMFSRFIRTVLDEILFSSIDVRVPSECVFLRLTGLPFVESLKSCFKNTMVGVEFCIAVAFCSS